MAEPTEPNRQSDRRPRERRVRLLLDRALSASAGVVAVTALAVSMYQAYISREQQKMSAWPYLAQSNTGAGGYARIVQNVGLGPALVRSMRVYGDGKPVEYWSDVISTTLGLDSARLVTQMLGARWTTSSVRPGMVLLPGTTTEIARVDSGAFARSLRRVLTGGRVNVRVCYCSLYGDCWVSDSKAMEPAEVRRCPQPDPALEFES